MKEFTTDEARRRLAGVLDRAVADGAVRIIRRDGQVFVIRPERTAASPLDVVAIEAGLSREVILEAIREGRRPT